MSEIQISQELEAKIRQSETIDEVVQACIEEGIPVTKAQLEAEMLPEVDGELSEDMLDNVSGGGILRIIHTIVTIYRASKYSGGGGGFSSGGGGGGSFGGGSGGSRF